MSSFQKTGLFLIAAHWAAVMWHLPVAAAIAPLPNGRIALAIGTMTVVHLAVFLGWWMRPTGLVSVLALLLFAIPLGFGSYEHLLSSGPNNVLHVSGPNSTAFEISVFLLLFLEICGIGLALRTVTVQPNRPAIGHS
jgi:hypothetical protein